MAKESNLYSPDDVGNTNGKIFGLPFNFDQSEIVVFPVPWDVTASFRAGTVHGPKRILEASPQLDLVDPQFGEVWKKGIYMLDISEEWVRKNGAARVRANELIKIQEAGHTIDGNHGLEEQLASVNQSCNELETWVYETSLNLLKSNKKLAVVGGDHSCPLGYLRALSQMHNQFGILQIDAHADLRIAYEGFEKSHASIMHNALKFDQVQKLLSVGLRDFSPNELKEIESNEKIQAFFDADIACSLHMGSNFDDICSQIIENLPDDIYISLDVDGLDPSLCPNTGTPVPGGISFNQISYLLARIKEDGINVIGFDLCETGNNEWDANVSARLLYKLCGLF